MTTTADDLTEIPVGEKVRINSRVMGHQWWTRTEEGFLRDGVTVEVALLRGALADGRVQRESEVIPVAGEVFSVTDDPTRLRLVVSVVEARIGWVSGGIEGVTYSDWPDDWSGWRRFPLPSEWPSSLAVAAAQSVQATVDGYRLQTGRVDELVAEVHRLNTEVASARARAREHPFPHDFVDGIHALLDDFDDDDDRDRVNEYLNDFGVAKVEDHEIDVTISGYTCMAVTTDLAQQEVGDEFTIGAIEESSRVHWQRVVSLTRTGFGCVCDLVDNSDVEEFLPDHYDEWNFEADCH